ncbi:hypothetical protein, partial [Acetobacter fabarum]|uniref:hypothetical protein n=1 Tax=Acetobacter fabarum TaxID=483199 RepID=UPI000BFAD233
MIVTSGGTEDGGQAAARAPHDPLARVEPARLRWCDKRGAGVSQAENTAGAGRMLVMKRQAKSRMTGTPHPEP